MDGCHPPQRSGELGRVSIAQWSGGHTAFWATAFSWSLHRTRGADTSHQLTSAVDGPRPTDQATPNAAGHGVLLGDIGIAMSGCDPDVISGARCADAQAEPMFRIDNHDYRAEDVGLGACPEILKAPEWIEGRHKPYMLRQRLYSGATDVFDLGSMLQQLGCCVDLRNNGQYGSFYAFRAAAEDADEPIREHGVAFLAGRTPATLLLDWIPRFWKAGFRAACCRRCGGNTERTAKVFADRGLPTTADPPRVDATRCSCAFREGTADFGVQREDAAA